MGDDAPKQPSEETAGAEEQLDVLLRDPRKKELLIRKLGLEANDYPREDDTAPRAEDGSGKRGSAKEPAQHLTPSGKSTGS